MGLKIFLSSFPACVTCKTYFHISFKMSQTYVKHMRHMETYFNFLLSDPTSVPCGVPTVTPITTRIVGGIVAKPGSWPWTV